MNHILRLNTNGSLDNTFTIGSGLNSRAFAIKVQADNKILVGGEFTEFDGETMNYFGRLNNCTINNTISTTQTTLSAVQTNASYQWIDCFNGNTDIVGQTSMSYTPTVEGSYAVRITTAECQVTSICEEIYICPLSNAVTLANNTITVNTIPQDPYFYWISGCEIDSLLEEYYDEDYIIAQGATLSSFTPTVSGNYGVVIISSLEECGVFSECIYVGLADLEENQQTLFSIYPNPANENVTISNIEAGSTITLMDVSGKSVSQQFSNSTSVNLQTSALTSGVYFVRVMNNNGISGIQKLVIE